MKLQQGAADREAEQAEQQEKDQVRHGPRLYNAQIERGLAMTLGRTSLIAETGAEPLSAATLDPIVV